MFCRTKPYPYVSAIIAIVLAVTASARAESVTAQFVCHLNYYNVNGEHVPIDTTQDSIVLVEWQGDSVFNGVDEYHLTFPEPLAACSLISFQALAQSLRDVSPTGLLLRFYFFASNALDSFRYDLNTEDALLYTYQASEMGQSETHYVPLPGTEAENAEDWAMLRPDARELIVIVSTWPGSEHLMQQLTMTWNELITDASSPPQLPLPQAFQLQQNFPNPFNPLTQINFSLAVTGQVKLSVYSLTGREVAAIFNGLLVAGNHHFVFDGSGLASGTYLYRLQSGDWSDAKKMVLLK